MIRRIRLTLSSATLSDWMAALGRNPLIGLALVCVAAAAGSWAGGLS